MEIKIKSKVKASSSTISRDKLVAQFIQKSELVETETLKVDLKLFQEAANQDNVNFEFMKLDSFRLKKECLQINNAKNALVEAEYGIAENGCVVFDSHDQELFLTICLAETLQVVLPASKILQTVQDLELIKNADYNELQETNKFVNASSRKADIDRFGPKNKRTLVYVIEDL
ncbi:MAG: LUD domain-containing protein [Marinifilaceae bacterium]